MSLVGLLSNEIDACTLMDYINCCLPCAFSSPLCSASPHVDSTLYEWYEWPASSYAYAPYWTKEAPLIHRLLSLLSLAAEGYSHGGSKRRLFGSCDGRRHLYCMRSASVKSVRHQQQPQLIGSGDCCGRLQRLRHQQQQQQQYYLNASVANEGDRRKSLSTPSLRITEATLRR